MTTPSFRPPPAQRVAIAGPAGTLAALLEEPASVTPGRFGVICHPHPQFGGTMDNKVVHTLARTFQEEGIAHCAVQFPRHWGQHGEVAHGLGETDDALAVIDWCRSRWPQAQPWLAGFSFGSFVALRASLQRETQRLVTVAPPVQRFDFRELRVPQFLWLVIQGDADEVVDYRAVMAWTHELKLPPTVKILSGVDHYFHGRLHELKDVLRAWLAEGVASAPA